MAVTAIWKWSFKSDGDANRAMQAAVRLVEDLKTQEFGSGVELSLWLRDTKEPFHYRHLLVCDSFETMERVRLSESVRRFFQELKPEVEVDTLESVDAEVTLSGGGTIDAMRLKVG